ncbi:MAG: hypothetical protein KatS3mg081_1066 [Gemmatimonadales bacterium]|nr:hypothetical protein HRbin33_00313 [bacterium HR33]GIW51711.1 MAG: hypothetical protein KatS3mg081_1066 [Gemmatimonadales bacterium]
MVELLGGLLLAVAAVALVLEPLFRPRLDRAALSAQDSGNEEDPLESESPKLRALVALREIEFDRATGKLAEEDYLRLKAKYEREALAAIEAEEAGQGLERPSAARGEVACPACGPRPEAAPVFCSSCGRLLVRERVA